MDSTRYDLAPQSDPVREYTEAEQQRLAENLLAIAEEVHRGDHISQPLTVDLLRFLHTRLFSSVRDHAGQIRRPGFGSPYLRFGPNRSVVNNKAPDELLDIFSECQRALCSFDENPEAPGYEEGAVRLAVWAHAELVRVHPFEDGNGRTARLVMDWILVRLGLRPIALEVVKHEYFACLNHYYAQKDLQPLVDLCIRLYPP